MFFQTCKDYDDDIENLQGQLNQQGTDLKGQVEKANQAISNLQSAQEGMKPQIKAAADAAGVAQAAADAANAAVKAANAAVKAAQATGDQAKIDAAKAADAAAAADAKAVAAAAEAAAANLAAVQAEANAIAKAEEKVQAAKTALEAQIEALKTAHAEDIAAINAEITLIKTDLDKVLGSVKVLEEKVAANAEAIVKLNGLTEELVKNQKETADKVTALETQLAGAKEELKAAVETLNATISTLDTKVETMKAELEGKLTQAIEKAEKELAAAQAALNTKIDELDTKFTQELKAQSEKIGALETELALQKSTFEAYKAQMEELHATFVTKEAFQAECDGIKERLTTAEAELAKVDGKIAEALASAKAYVDEVVAANVQQLEEKIGANKTAIEKLQAEVEADKQALVDAKAECKQAREDLEKLVKAYADTQDEAVKKDLQTKIDAVQKNLDAANAELAALTARVAANETQIGLNKASIAKLEESIAKFGAQAEANKNDIAALKQKVDKEVGIAAKAVTNLETKLNEKIKTDLKKLENQLRGEYQSMVTELSVVSNTLIAKNTQLNPFDAITIAGNPSIHPAWAFGKGICSTTIPFTPGALVSTGEDELVVRVTPADADLSEANIQFVNSKNQNLDSHIKVVKVEPYKQNKPFAGSRAVAAETGLWTIKITRTNSKNADYAKAVKEDGNFASATTTDYIKFAVKINDVKRPVLTDFEVTFDKSNYTPASDLKFTVDGTDVAKIRNRYNGTASSKTESNAIVTYEELKWASTPSYPIAGTAKDNDTSSPTSKNDIRNTKDVYTAELGKKFTIKLTESAKIRAFYVTLDKDCAVESNELMQWTSYNIMGLNTMSEGNTLDITVPASAVLAKGDYIGFRVYAVNYNGTLADPDGRAFYVKVAGQDTQNTVSLIAKQKSPLTVPYSVQAFETGKANASLANWAGAAKLSIKLVGPDPAPAVNPGVAQANVHFYKKTRSGDAIISIANWATITATEATDLVKAYKISIDGLNSQSMVDGVKYTYELKATDNTGAIVGKKFIEITKELPSTIPGQIKLKPGNDENQVIKVYPQFVFVTGSTTPSQGYYAVTDLYDGLVKAGTLIHETSFIFEEAETVATKKKLLANSWTASSLEIRMNSDYVNPAANNAKYAPTIPMKVGFDYGAIGYDVNKTTSAYDHKVYGKNITIQPRNFVDDIKANIVGTVEPIVYAGVNGGVAAYVSLDKLQIVDPYGSVLAMDKLMAGGVYTRVNFGGIEVLSDGKVSPYYMSNGNLVHYDAKTKTYVPAVPGKPATHLELVSIANNTALTQNVKTELRLTLTDDFGFTIKKMISGSFIMKPTH